MGVRRFATIVLTITLMAGCSAGPREGAGGGVRTIDVAGRPATLFVPKSYDPGTPAPLFVLLHGYSSSGAIQENYLRIAPEADRRGFLYALPDGTPDRQRKQFWNATDACCGFGSTVDDSAYLSQLITAIQAAYAVDSRRVYLMGHSNGAFMAYRMACDHADQVTAIAALNGAMWSDVSRCRPTRGVSVLTIHSVDDDTIRYEGESSWRTYPSAATTVADWVNFNGCPTAPDTTSVPALDLVAPAGDRETTVARYAGCRDSVSVEFWSIASGGHLPTFRPTYVPAVLDFLAARRKPAG